MSNESRNTWIRADGKGNVICIDAAEMDVSLVSTADPTPARPVVYLLIDTYTNEIVYAHVTACAPNTLH